MGGPFSQESVDLEFEFEDAAVLSHMVKKGLVAALIGSVLMVKLALPGEVSDEQSSKPLRAGIIGLDTSHVVQFSKILNAKTPKPEVAGVRIVAAYPAGSPDVTASRTRVAGYTKQLHDDFGVTIVDSIDELLPKVDVVFLESVDGRPHLEQARPVLKAHKPVFIDKPVAGSLADAIAIFDLARETNTPCFSSSSIRFTPGTDKLRKDPNVGEIIGCDTYGPCQLEEHHPDLFWYGIHGVEKLFTIMGTDCQSVSRTQTDRTELVVGVWKDGKVGTFRGLRRAPYEYGGTVYGTKRNVSSGGDGGYEPMLTEVVKFFKTGKPPVTADETLAIYAFMEAADESKRQGGKPVTIESVMTKARAQLTK
jgi:hypothetical protein